MEENNSSELIAMQIIAASGDARSNAFNALKLAREGKFEECDALIKDAEKSINEAHKIQMDLLVNEANGNKIDCGILLIHAQDHFMTSMLAIDLAKEIIELRKEKQ